MRFCFTTCCFSLYIVLAVSSQPSCLDSFISNTGDFYNHLQIIKLGNNVMFIIYERLKLSLDYYCKTQNSGLCSKEEKPCDPINESSRCNMHEDLLTVAQTG